MTAQPSIEVISVATTNAPAHFKNLTQSDLRACLYKAASKASETGDLIKMGEDLFSCGWQDLTLTYRIQGASESEVRELTLVRQRRHEGRDHKARPASPCPHSCQLR